MSRKMLRNVEKRGVLAARLPLEPGGTGSKLSYYPGNQAPHKSLQPIRSSNSRSRLPRDQRSTTESTEIHGKENPNQLPLSVSFPGATPARRVGSFRGYAFVMIFLAVVILLHAPRPRREGGQLRVHRGGTGRPLDETLMPVTSRAGTQLPQTRHACPCFGHAVRAR